MKNKTPKPKTAPAKVWVIMDPQDGAHLFVSRSQAEKTMIKWEKEAKGDPMDSVWDMTGPFEYQFSK